MQRNPRGTHESAHEYPCRSIAERIINGVKKEELGNGRKYQVQNGDSGKVDKQVSIWFGFNLADDDADNIHWNKKKPL